jgi:hypothetical protein
VVSAPACVAGRTELKVWLVIDEETMEKEMSIRIGINTYQYMMVWM